jgi:hypothetical protein
MLILTKPLIKPSNLLHSQLSSLTYKSQLILLYKQFYRLRNLVGNHYHTQKYATILRRQFQRQDFNQRRRIVLGISTNLSQDQLIQRLETTLDFVFNSTVKRTSYNEEVRYYNDIKRLSPDTIEKKVLRTLLEMDDKKPDQIKHDFAYEWVRILSEPEEPQLKQTNSKKLKKAANTFKGFPINYLGFKQQEVSIMRLNENLGLCL